MNQSDWIALAACVAAFLALIPAFAPMLRNRKLRQKPNGAHASPPPSDSAEPAEPAKLNAFGKAMLLTSMGLVIGVIEIVLFSAIATLFGIAVDVNTMPINWLTVFYALFLFPGICFIWASAHLFNLWE